MKAVKSELAKRLLADPEARVQIRHSASSGQFVGSGKAATRPTVTVRDATGVRYARVVVPKAA